jgi:type II secretory pathway pseudopilin PulG
MKYRKKFFNMVEIVLAIAVIAFGMSSILVLFPVGLNASRDSVADNYSSCSVEQFISYIQTFSANPADTSPADGVPDNYNNLFISSLGGSDVLLPDVTGKATATDINTDSEKFVDYLMQSLAGGPALNPVKTGWDIYRAAENGGTSGSKKSIYFMVHRSNGTSAATPKYDFMAAMAVWKSEVRDIVKTSYSANNGEVLFNSGATATADLYKYSGMLNVEISWPLNKEYSQRRKRYYQFIIRNPQP